MSMKTKVLGYSALIAMALLASCSSDDDDDDGKGSAGSSSGVAGSSGSGSSQAGSSSGGSSSGSGGKAGGGTSSAGTSTTAGTGSGLGGFNFGGGGFDPDEVACDPVPEPGSDCDAEAQPCLKDGSEVCLCAMGQWACMDIFGGGGGGAPGGELECPAAKPASGAACDAFGVCPYGENDGCLCNGSMWVCA